MQRREKGNREERKRGGQRRKEKLQIENGDDREGAAKDEKK